MARLGGLMSAVTSGGEAQPNFPEFNQVMMVTYMGLLKHRHYHQKPTGEEKDHWKNNIDLRNSK